jgi:2'-5' RNA ligase
MAPDHPSRPPLAVVAYPTLDPADRQWIESVRARHDPQASRIEAHVTLVFPAELLPEPVLAHLSASLAGYRSIAFAMPRAEAVADPIGGGAHVFLVPDEGREELTALHDRLYQGVLAPLLRREVPFVPHITIAAHTQLEACQGLARELNRAHPVVRGSIRELQLIEVGDGSVRSLRGFALAERRSSA